jgi:hypothetical protein
MIIRFLQGALVGAYPYETQFEISSAFRSLKPDFPHLTPRLLDHAIWNYERDKGAAIEPAPEVTATTKSLTCSKFEKP